MKIDEKKIIFYLYITFTVIQAFPILGYLFGNLMDQIDTKIVFNNAEAIDFTIPTYVKLTVIAIAFIFLNYLFIKQIKNFISKPLSSDSIFYEFFIVFFTGLSNILLFAYVYYLVGIVGNDILNPITEDLQTSLYFSIVTWTTLGYGDLKPVESLRLVAASEALIGYIYMALLVGLFLSIIQLKVKKS